MSEQIEPGRTKWHQLLGALLVELLEPIGVKVVVEFAISAEPPIGDVLLIQQQGQNWTVEQLERLPDGMRDDPAEIILIEFKYTEAVDIAAVRQTFMLYELFLRSQKQLRRTKSYLVGAKRPQKVLFESYGYQETGLEGVFASSYPLVSDVIIISLNDLANKPHNAFFKCFASQRQEKAQAFELIRTIRFVQQSGDLYWLLNGLALHWFEAEDETMSVPELTPEKARELGKQWGKLLLHTLPPSEVMDFFRPEERLQGLRPEERLQGLTVEEIEAYLIHLKGRNVSGFASSPS